MERGRKVPPWLVVALLAGVSAASASSVALARPRPETPRVQFGVMGRAFGAGCASASFSTSTRATRPLRFTPPVGANVGMYVDLLVTDTEVADGRARWTVQPPGYECAVHADDPSWSWAGERRGWGLTYREPAYVVRASRWGGVRSIAGWRVDRRTRRSAPTIRKARRHFGRPSSISRDATSCHAHWRRMRLTMVFVNYGGRHPCRHGFAQAGFVRARGPRRTWTVLVGDRPGVAAGTRRGFLDYALIGEPGRTRGYWTLAEVFLPYGDPGYYPSVAAIFDRRARVSAFELWIGAGGH